MKFDFCIGNPPYQDSTIGDNTSFAPPVYDKFMDAAFTIADKVELIHPARFLFNAGSTPKSWNKKMLNNEHFKVLRFFEDSKDVFSNVGISGGVAITYESKYEIYNPIRMYIPFKELNNIYLKVSRHDAFIGINTIAVTAYAYRFTQIMHEENPSLRDKLSKGHDYDLKSSVLKRIPEIFHDKKPNDNEDYALMLGRIDNVRIKKYIKRNINDVINFDAYKVMIPKAGGTGGFGAVLSPLEIGIPHEGHIETFLSIGCFSTENEAKNCMKYLKCKFTRALLGILKVTQDNPPETWKNIPIQDFTSNSDIDWSQSIPDIDKQLYKKYGLSQEEIDFIETHVKEMS